MTITLYVAGASKEIDRCEAFMRAAQALGFELTYDWVSIMRQAPAPDGELDEAILRAIGTSEIDAVLESELFVLLHPQPGSQSTGCWTELGAILAVKRLQFATFRNRVVCEPAIVAVCPEKGLRKGPFWPLADHVVSTDDEALSFLADVMAEARAEAQAE